MRLTASFTAMLLAAMLCMTMNAARAEENPADAIQLPDNLTPEQIQAIKSGMKNQAAQEKAKQVDAPNSTADVAESSHHGIRERLRQYGVFADPMCVAKGDKPECYCAAHLALPVFGRRVYGAGANRLNYNIWEWADDHFDQAYCPAKYSDLKKDTPESYKEKAKLAFFQTIRVPVFNKNYVSLVYDTYEHTESGDVIDIKYGILVDVAKKRPLPLGAIIGAGQDGVLNSFVNAELKKKAAGAQPVKFSRGESEEVTTFYLAPQGVVLQFGTGSIADDDLGTLSVTLPPSMISNAGVRELIVAPKQAAKG